MARTNGIRLHHGDDGTPYVRVSLGASPVTGRPVRRQREFPGMSDAEAMEAAARWVAALRESAGDPTVGEMLRGHVDTLAAMGRSAKTISTYRLFAERYARPIAGVRASALDSWTVERHLTDLVCRGCDGRPLSRRTVATYRHFLSSAFRHMVKAGALASNPVEGTTTIRWHHDSVALTRDDYRALWPLVRRDMALPLDRCRDAARANAAMAMEIALRTGMRVGEVCALRRRDLVATGSGHALRVTATAVRAGGDTLRREGTKGGRGRTVAIDDGLRAEIAAHERRQDREGMLAAGPDTPIVSATGSWTSPESVSARFGRLAREAGMPEGVSFHSLRHTHASWLLAAGASPNVVQERLGHADVATTLRLYGHVMPGQGEEVAGMFAGMAEADGGEA